MVKKGLLTKELVLYYKRVGNRDIGIKKGISEFSFFAFNAAQNTHKSDTMRPVKPTSLSIITKG